MAMFASLRLLACAALLVGVTLAAAPPSLSADTVIVVDARDVAVPAFRLALADFEKDFYAVLGSPPVVLQSPPGTPPAAAAVQMNTLSPSGAVLLGTQQHMGATATQLLGVSLSRECFRREESHCVALAVQGAAATGQLAAPVVCAVGAGTLGAVFAIYALSEAVLSVSPLHHFAELPPARAMPGGVPLSAILSVPLLFSPSGFAVRGLFVNDEDLLAGFAADPLGDGIDASTYNKVYEAVLRLKGNAIISGTANFVDQRGGTTLAATRGLRILQHHVTPLGLNVMRWPNEPVSGVQGGAGFSSGGAPFSFDKSPEVMEQAWGQTVDALLDALPPTAAPSPDITWTVGLRGLNDYAWWLDDQGDPRVANNTVRGSVISSAMQKQMSIVRSRLPAGGDFIAYLWSESLALYKSGDLVIPEGVTVVVADNGGGTILGLDCVKPGDGLYYHVCSRANQLSEGVSVAKIFEELAAFMLKARPISSSSSDAPPPLSSVFILNGSDLKPYLLSLAAAFSYAFDPRSTGSDATAFTSLWAARHYGVGAETAATITSIYASYNQLISQPAPALMGSDYGLAINLDNLGEDMLRVALQQHAQPGPANFSSLSAEAKALLPSGRTQAAQWSNVSAGAAKQLPLLAERVRPMFLSHVLSQQWLHGNASLAIAFLAESILTSSSKALEGAIESVDGVLGALRVSEGSTWRGIMAHDRLVDFQHTRRLLLQVKSAAFSKQTALCPTRPLCSCTGAFHNCSGSLPYAQCPGIFANQLAPAYDARAYPLLRRSSNQSRNMDGIVRGGCSGGCRTTPSGGLVAAEEARGAPVTSVFWLKLGPGVSSAHKIRYTLNGDVPTVASTLYVAGQPVPLVLSPQTHSLSVTARLFWEPSLLTSPSPLCPVSVFSFFPSPSKAEGRAGL